MTAALEEGECSAARSGRTLPPGKTRYPIYRRLGGHRKQKIGLIMLGMVRIVILHDRNSVSFMLTPAFREGEGGDMLSPSAEFV